MYDLIVDLFTQAQTLHTQNPGAQILVDYYATTTPTNSLNALATAVMCSPLGTLTYTPEKKSSLEKWSAASFSPAAGDMAPALSIVHGGSFRENAIRFANMPLAPTPTPASPVGIINVDATTNAIYGVVGAGSTALFVTITLANIRAEKTAQ